MNFVARCKLAFGFGLVAAVGATSSAQPEVDRSAPPLRLPKFEVSADALPAQLPEWRFARMPGGTVLSNASDYATRSVTRALQEFDHALGLIYPQLKRDPSRPFTVILAEARTYEEICRTLPPPLPASVLLRSPENPIFVINLDATEDDNVDPEDNTSTAFEPHDLLNREYLRFLLAQQNVHFPVWLEGGLLQTVADIEVRDQWLTYGRVETERNMRTGEQPAHFEIPDFLAPNATIAPLSFKQVFSNRRFQPFDEFFAARRPDGSPPASDSAWAKQAYAFVHFCLFGGKLRYRGPLSEFARRLQNEPLSEPLFTACFGLTYRQMQDELRSYLLHTSHQYQRYPLKPEQVFVPQPLELADASPDEIGLYHAGALDLAGSPAYALALRRLAHQHGARSGDFLAGYAASLLTQGDRDRAEKAIDEAIAAAPTRPSAYVLQARLRLDRQLATASETGGQLNQAQLGQVLEPLFAARKLSPSIPATYVTIAEAWIASATPPKPQHLAVLDEGILKFPREKPLLLRTFALYHRIGDTHKASSIARLGARLAPDTTTREEFETLVASLPPPASPGG